MNDSTAAIQDPSSYLWSGRFWRRHSQLGLCLILGMGLVAYLFYLNFPKGTSWIGYASLLLHGFALWGMYEAARVLACIDIELAIASVVRRQATDELSKIDAHVDNRIELTDISSRVMPVNPSERVRVLQTFDRVIQDAKDRKFETLAIVTTSFREAIVGDVLRLQTIQRTALHFGILGTFVGLVIAFGSMNSDPNSYVGLDLPGLMQLLHVSFSASVAGLEASVIIGLTVVYLRKKQDALVLAVDEAAAALLSLSRQAINRDVFMSAFTQVREEVTKQTAATTALSGHVAEQTRSITTGIGQLVQTEQKYAEFLAEVRKSQDAFVAEMKKVYDVLSPQEIGDRLKESLSLAVEGIGASVQSEMKSAFSDIQAVNASLVEAAKASERQAKSAEEFAAHIQASHRRVEQAVTDHLSRLRELQSEGLAEFQRRLRTELSAARITRSGGDGYRRKATFVHGAENQTGREPLRKRGRLAALATGMFRAFGVAGKRGSRDDE